MARDQEAGNDANHSAASGPRTCSALHHWRSLLNYCHPLYWECHSSFVKKKGRIGFDFVPVVISCLAWRMRCNIWFSGANESFKVMIVLRSRDCKDFLGIMLGYFSPTKTCVAYKRLKIFHGLPRNLCMFLNFKIN